MESCKSLKNNALTLHHHYPYGMMMPERDWSSESGYRFGFNKEEKDQSTINSSTSIHFRFRMYNPNISRFISVDPLLSEYPYNSPYSFSGNRVIDAKELEGLEFVFGAAPWWLIAAENNSTMIRPITETVVKTGIERPIFNPKLSPIENVVNRNLRWGNLNHEAVKQGFSKISRNEVVIQSGKGGSRIDNIEFATQFGRRVAILREIKPNTSWGRNAGPETISRYMKDFLKSDLAKGIDEIVPELYYYQPVLGLFYTVQPGDNIWQISKDFEVSSKQLEELNGLDTEAKIFPGQTLLIDVAIEDIIIKVDYTIEQDNTRVATPKNINIDNINDDDQ